MNSPLRSVPEQPSIVGRSDDNAISVMAAAVAARGITRRDAEPSRLLAALR
jgi:hypothetical protein